MIVNRSTYIDQLIRSKGNGLIKIITGLRRSGKSFLLKKLFRQHLLDDGVKEDHIIIIDMESRKNKPFKDPDYLLDWVEKEMKDLMAEVQSRVGNLPPVQVAFYDAGEEQIGVYGSGLNSDMIALAGGENVFADETDVYLQVSKEVFAVKTPQIFAVLDYEGAAGVPDEIARANFLFTTFPNMRASKDKRWVPVSGAAFAAGIRIPNAFEAMAKASHPEAFK